MLKTLTSRCRGWMTPDYTMYGPCFIVFGSNYYLSGVGVTRDKRLEHLSSIVIDLARSRYDASVTTWGYWAVLGSWDRECMHTNVPMEQGDDRKKEITPSQGEANLRYRWDSFGYILGRTPSQSIWWAAALKSLHAPSMHLIVVERLFSRSCIALFKCQQLSEYLAQSGRNIVTYVIEFMCSAACLLTGGAPSLEFTMDPLDGVKQ